MRVEQVSTAFKALNVEEDAYKIASLSIAFDIQNQAHVARTSSETLNRCNSPARCRKRGKRPRRFR